MAYTPPNGTNADFELLSYTPPSGTSADFDFTDKLGAEVLSELVGYEAIDSEILSELTGGGSDSEILSELTGSQDIDDEILSELEGSGQSSEILSEVSGYQSASSEILSEIIGFSDLPKKLGYRIIVKDSAGNVIGEVDTYNSVKFGKRLNNYGQAEFSMKVADPKAIDFVDLRKNTIEIYRESELSNTLVWAGEQALARARLNESGNNWVTVHSFTWFEQLFHRYTASEVEYGDVGSEMDQGAIAEDLIDTTNADDPTKIAIGTITPTFDRIRKYYNQNIAEAIINLANVQNGFDFEVTDAGAFNADLIIGTDKTDSVVFRYGHNVKNVEIIEDFTNPINRAIVLGEAVGETTLQRVERNDSALQTEYGLREGRLQELDVSGLSTLEDKGDASIRKYGEVLLKVEFDLIKNVTPSIDQFTVGDGIRLIIQNGMYNIDEQYRVFEWEVTFDEKSTEKLKLTLGKFIVI